MSSSVDTIFQKICELETSENDKQLVTKYKEAFVDFKERMKNQVNKYKTIMDFLNVLYGLRDEYDELLPELRQFRVDLAIESAEPIRADETLRNIGVGYIRNTELIGYTIIEVKHPSYHSIVRGRPRFVEDFKSIDTDEAKKKFLEKYEKKPEICYADVAHLDDDKYPFWHRFIYMTNDTALDSGWTTDKEIHLHISSKRINMRHSQKQKMSMIMNDKTNFYLCLI
jgi:hypothetical protein